MVLREVFFNNKAGKLTWDYIAILILTALGLFLILALAFPPIKDVIFGLVELIKQKLSFRI